MFRVHASKSLRAKWKFSMSDIVAGGGKSEKKMYITYIELRVSQAPSDIISLSSRIFHHLMFEAETMKGGGDL